MGRLQPVTTLIRLVWPPDLHNSTKKVAIMTNEQTFGKAFEASPLGQTLDDKRDNRVASYVPPVEQSPFGSVTKAALDENYALDDQRMALGTGMKVRAHNAYNVWGMADVSQLSYDSLMKFIQNNGGAMKILLTILRYEEAELAEDSPTA